MSLEECPILSKIIDKEVYFKFAYTLEIDEIERLEENGVNTDQYRTKESLKLDEVNRIENYDHVKYCQSESCKKIQKARDEYAQEKSK